MSLSAVSPSPMSRDSTEGAVSARRRWSVHCTRLRSAGPSTETGQGSLTQLLTAVRGKGREGVGRERKNESRAHFYNGNELCIQFARNCPLCYHILSLLTSTTQYKLLHQILILATHFLLIDYLCMEHWAPFHLLPQTSLTMVTRRSGTL